MNEKCPASDTKKRQKKHTQKKKIFATKMTPFVCMDPDTK